MALEHELRQLRRDLDEVAARTSEISRRLARLQAEADEERRHEPPRSVASEPPPPPPVRRAPEPHQPLKPPAVPSYYATPRQERSAESPISGLDGVEGTEEERQPLAELWQDTAAGRFVRERWDTFNARRNELGWEVLVGTYGLPRIAMVCITIAVVFFLSLAIERWGSQWLPHLRVAIGYAVCAGLLVMAWRFEPKYAGLARVLYGGGFAVMYFVTFATHYVTFARVFESPVPTLVLLTAVVVGWAVAAQVRRSKVIAVLVTALGHLTVLLSALTVERSAPFSTAGLVFLSAGSAFFLLRNRWYYVASLGVVGCYVNDILILSNSRGGNPYVDFWVSMGVLSTFFLIFALAELFSHEELRRDLVPTWFRSCLVTVNTAAFLLIGTALVSRNEFTRDHQDLFRFVSAAALLLIGLGYLRLRAGDPLFNVYFVKAVALATLALATRYGGSTLAAWLAIETVVLLVSARRSGLIVTRLLAFVVAAITLLYTVPLALWSRPPFENYPAELLIAGLQVVAFLVASQLYQRTNWPQRSPHSAPVSAETAEKLWALDLISEPPAGVDNLQKPAEGLLFPYAYALGAALLYFAQVKALLAFGDRLPMLAAFALAMAAAAYFLNSKPFGLVSVVAAAAVAFPVGALEAVAENGFSVQSMAGGLVAFAAVALASEAGRAGIRRGLDVHQNPAAPYILYGQMAMLAALAMYAQLNAFNCTAALAVSAVVAGALVFLLHPVAWGGIALGFLAWASVSLMTGLGDAVEPRWRALCWVLAVLLVAADRYFSRVNARIRFGNWYGAASVVLCMAVLWRYIGLDAPQEWFVASMVLTCFAFCAYGMGLRSAAAFAVGVAVALAMSWLHIKDAFQAKLLEYGLVGGFMALALFWVALERALAVYGRRHGERIQKAFAAAGIKSTASQLAFVPVILLTVVLLVMAYRVPLLLQANRGFITIGWFAIAAVHFVLSLAFRQREFRYAGLAVIVLSLLRLFIVDMSEQDPLLRVAAFAVVGAGLLSISVGYYKWMARVKAAKAEQTQGTPPAQNGQQ